MDSPSEYQGSVLTGRIIKLKTSKKGKGKGKAEDEEKLNRLLQEIAWETVTSQLLTGVKK